MAQPSIKGVSDFVGAPEVAQILGVSRMTLRRYVAGGKVPKPIDLPGRPRWLKSDIEAMLRKAGAL